MKAKLLEYRYHLRRYLKRMLVIPSPRWFLWGIGGVLLAGVIHILIVLNVPVQVPYSTYETVAKLGPDRMFNLLPPVLPRTEPLPDLDPALRYAICRFEMKDGPVRLSADLASPFWSIALFNAKGQTIYSLNDRTADEDGLTMLLITKEQLSILRENPPRDLEEMIVVETTIDKGYALLRAFQPTRAHAPRILKSLDDAECSSQGI
ncbi:DUF1254 domain-containing protein [Flexibacterium corallicola]|uniref:DUF1254 domain-containing protein n=1 Tax=Flexibacterium corallicola TaxID=3037259 RepID=UPI00286EBF8E|nr:hypothetical protein [Pseudovibrio sp. M1P-2-3]